MVKGIAMHDIQNQDLYESLRNLMIKVLNNVRDNPGKYLVNRDVFSWIKKDNGSYVRQISNRPVWWETFFNVVKDVKETEEFARVCDVVNADESIAQQFESLVGTKKERTRLEIETILYHLFVAVLTDDGIPGEFEECVFKKEYLRVESDLYSEEIEFEQITPLSGFSMDGSCIKLSEGLEIIEMSDSDIIDFLNKGILIGSVLSQDIVFDVCKYAIRKTYKFKKIIGDDFKGNLDDEKNTNDGVENKVVNALHIFKEGEFYPIAVCKRSASIFPLGKGFGSIGFQKRVIRRGFSLNGKEADDFVSFWRKYSEINLSGNQYLNVAIRRFGQSCEKINEEDKIIDFMICAEALFLSSDGNNELSYRLSHRAALYLENESVKQREVFEFMRKAYSVRSNIVHGKNVKQPISQGGKNYTLKEFCDDLEKYIRAAIRKNLESIFSYGEGYRINWLDVMFLNARG